MEDPIANKPVDEDNDPVIIASKNKDLDSLGNLLRNDPSYNTLLYNNGLLRWTASQGYLEFVQIALDRGADVNHNNFYPLEIASKQGHNEIVDLLIKSGARVTSSGDVFDDRKNYMCNCAMSEAFNNKHFDICRMLENAGASLRIQKDGVTSDWKELI